MVPCGREVGWGNELKKRFPVNDPREKKHKVRFTQWHWEKGRYEKRMHP